MPLVAERKHRPLESYLCADAGWIAEDNRQRSAYFTPLQGDDAANRQAVIGDLCSQIHRIVRQRDVVLACSDRNDRRLVSAQVH